VRDQSKKDKLVVDLLDTVCETYASVQELLERGLDLTEHQKRVCQALLEQTIECAWFIHDYASGKYCEY
jgi:hypothetical protein